MKKAIPFVSREPQPVIDTWLDELKNKCPDFTFVTLDQTTPAQRKAAEVALVANPEPNDLAQLQNLKWVQSLWAGVERLVADLPSANFSIVRMVDPQLAETMAEAVLAWTLYLHRDMPRYRDQQAQKIWRQHDVPMPCERTVGILGLGTLGTLAAQKLAQHGFTVGGWSRNAKDVAPNITAFHGSDGLSQILGQSNYLIVLLPLTPATTGLLNHQTLGALPRGAALINFGRGPIVDDKALLTQLDNDHLSHAVLDVFATEPLGQKCPYWAHPKVTVLPHISAPTTISTATQIAVDNIQRYFADNTIPLAVDRARGY